MTAQTLKLGIELVPESSWHMSLANLLPKPVWDTLRREVYLEFNYTCAICSETNCRMNCHEVWRYDDKKHIQYLKGFQALCDACHSIKHWGRTVALVHEGKLPETYLAELTEHFCKVNGCTVEFFANYRVEIGNLSQKRSKHKYIINFGRFTPEKVIEVWRKKQGLK